MKSPILLSLGITIAATVPSGIAAPLDAGTISKSPKVGVSYSLPITPQSLAFNEANGRTFYVPLRLRGEQNIKVTIEHGFDNSGDKGMTWSLLDAIGGKEIASGFTKEKKAKSWTVRGIVALNPILVLEDKDSKFNGKAGGNGFYLSVSLVKK